MLLFFYFDQIAVGPIIFHTWGIFLALAFLLVFSLVYHQFKKDKEATDLFFDLLIWVLLGALIGARLGYVVQFWEYLKQPLRVLQIWDGGMTFYGGFIGGVVAYYLYFKIHHLTNSTIYWQLIKEITLYLPLGIAVGRIGCFLINDHQGSPTNLPWGINWPDGITRHPVALYLIINALVIFVILHVLKKKFNKNGQIFYLFLLLYSGSRFFLDFTRSRNTDLSDPIYLKLSSAQWISLMLIFLGILFWKKNRKSSLAN